MRVIIAAAGTGGHINPGIAIANTIKQREPSSEIMFIGTKRGLENDLVPRANYKLEKIEAYGFNGKVSFNNGKKIFKTMLSTLKAKKIIKKFKPDIVIGTGGYICIPTILAASSLKIPTVLHESNAFPGSAVKMMAKRTSKILVGFEDAKERIKNAKKVVVTGTPTKVKDLNLTTEEKDKIKQDLGFNKELPLVLVFGGSQGAKSINDAFLGIFENNLNKNYQIMYATGPEQYNVLKEYLASKNLDIEKINNAKIVPYIYNMEEVLNACNLVICRSGALTITEVSIVGKPAIFVPLGSVVANRQIDNAKVLEKIGAAKIILDKDLNTDILSNSINDLISNTNNLRSMGEKAKTIGIKNTEEIIYKEINNLVKK